MSDRLQLSSTHSPINFLSDNNRIIIEGLFLTSESQTKFSRTITSRFFNNLICWLIQVVIYLITRIYVHSPLQVFNNKDLKLWKQFLYRVFADNSVEFLKVLELIWLTAPFPDKKLLSVSLKSTFIKRTNKRYNDKFALVCMLIILSTSYNQVIKKMCFQTRHIEA